MVSHGRARKLLRSCSLLLAACAAHPHLHYDPELLVTDLRGDSDDVQARVVAIWRGVRERERVPELTFRVRVENPRSTPFPLAPAEFELLSEAQVSLGAAHVRELPATVEAGQSVTLDLAFPIKDLSVRPRGDDPPSLSRRTAMGVERDVPAQLAEPRSDLGLTFGGLWLFGTDQSGTLRVFFWSHLGPRRLQSAGGSAARPRHARCPGDRASAWTSSTLPASITRF